MNIKSADLTPRVPDARLDNIIKLAVMAVGGQGGGVLTNWIEDLARSQDFACQATSVAGVAQRTGATIYYVEMAPVSEHTPVFSLAPAAGDVDILIAAEMMEAGRAIMRGFVTPDRTTLIASSHRSLAVSEKMVPGDGISSSDEVKAAAEISAARFIEADMEHLAVSNGSVISASLFGALAGTGALPFDRAAFEDAIRRGGKGVAPSLLAFASGFEAASNGVKPAESPAKTTVDGFAPTGPSDALSEWRALLARINTMPEDVQAMARPGLRKVVGYQDTAYGQEYLEYLEALLARDSETKGNELSIAAAKYISNAMTYDDVIRVADLKTRSARYDRIRREMGAGEDKTMQLTEFMHPRAEEILGLMPAKMGARLAANPKWIARLDRWFNKGRRLRTDSLRAFLPLYALGGVRGWRRRTWRHAQEQAHIQNWIERALGYVENDYDLAVEIVKCRRLIKGYSDTHERGMSKFDRVLEGADLVAGRDDAAHWVARLREAALKDEKGLALEGALKTIRSFLN